MTAVKYAGLNAIHLYAGQVHDDGDPSTDWRNTDSIVEWARQESLYVVMLCGGGAKQGAETMIGLARTSWEFYAPRYADQTHVVYELLNEPCLATYYCDEAVMQGIKELHALVRDKAPDTHIMLMSHSNLKGGIDALFTDVERLGPEVDWSNASIAFHGYGTTGAFQEQAARTLGEAGYVMSCTEFPFSGAGELARSYEKAGISYFWFEACWGGGRSPGTIKGYLSRTGISWQPDFGDWPQPHAEHITLSTVQQASRFVLRGMDGTAFERAVLRLFADGDMAAVYDIRGRLLSSGCSDVMGGPDARIEEPRGSQLFLIRRDPASR